MDLNSILVYLCYVRHNSRSVWTAVEPELQGITLIKYIGVVIDVRSSPVHKFQSRRHVSSVTFSRLKNLAESSRLSFWFTCDGFDEAGDGMAENMITERRNIVKMREPPSKRKATLASRRVFWSNVPFMNKSPWIQAIMRPTGPTTNVAGIYAAICCFCSHAYLPYLEEPTI